MTENLDMLGLEVHRKDGEIEHRPKSKGGKIFDIFTYYGIAGLGTFLITIPIANLFMGKGARFEKFDHGLKNILTKNFRANGAVAENLANTVHTGHGGNLMVIPVMAMEHFRTPIVNGLNRLFKDPTDPESVKEAPPQTASSVMKGRALAYATTAVAFNGVEFAVGQERFKGILDKSGSKLCEILKHSPTTLSKTGEVVKSRTYKIGRTGALDLLATVCSATLLYFGSHFFSNRAVEKKFHNKEQTPAPEAANEKPAVMAELENDKPKNTVNYARRDAAIAQPPTAEQVTL